MLTQFLIDCLKANEPFAWLELQIELWRQRPTPENYGQALEAWVTAEQARSAEAHQSGG